MQRKGRKKGIEKEGRKDALMKSVGIHWRRKELAAAGR
jgi:hypothetical protein